MMGIHEAIYTHRYGGWGQDDITLQGVFWLIKYKVTLAIFLNTMHNNLH